MKVLATGAIGSWFATFHPRYRGALGGLASLAALTGLLVYAENAALEAIIGAMSGAAMGGVAGALGTLRPSSLAPAWFFLGAYAAISLLRTAVGTAHGRVSGRLGIRARNDLEREVLGQLLRKEDAFFRERSTGEILNRLATDVGRATELRSVWMQNARSAFLLAGNVYFFVVADWRLALAGVLTTAAGVWATGRMTRPVKAMDRDYLESDDRVKSRFEDLLAAAPEVQVGNLHRRVVARFDEALDRRAEVHRRYVSLQTRMTVAQGLSYLIALLSLFIVTLVLLSGRSVDGAVALAPVFLKALPELFSNAAAIVYSRLDLMRSRTSCERLLEYQSEAEPACSATADASLGEGLVLEKATLQYHGPGGEPQGGVVELQTTFPRGAWIGLAGRAGAGKSTLLQLLCGRARPQRGAVLVGGRPLVDLPAEERAALVALMPQKVALLNGTIGENLRLGVAAAEAGALDAADLEVLEAVGTAELCRRKALDLLPSAAPAALGPRVVALRGEARRRLADELRLRVEPYEAGAVDGSHWLVEALATGRGDRGELARCLCEPGSSGALGALAGSPAGRILVETGRALVESSRELLELPGLQPYNAMAPFPLTEELLRVRREALAQAGSAVPASGGAALVAAALTASVAELPAASAPGADLSTAEGLQRLREALRGPPGEALRRLLGGRVAPFDPGTIHPHLTWRENLVFAAVEAPNRRLLDRVEQLLLDLLRADGLATEVTRLGLAYPVGRAGDRLSGGQRQLVAMSRALLPRTPIVILDEPTSALDPASRDRVIALLRAWRRDRVVITVTHDPVLLAAADEVRLIEAGRLVGAGPFDALRESSSEFRAIFNAGSAGSAAPGRPAREGVG